MRSALSFEKLIALSSQLSADAFALVVCQGSFENEAIFSDVQEARSLLELLCAFS
ncbi:MAG: hypothetical protein F6J93_39880 [Oscillatoria sp. SIO1A7]|nr:hypothetical protein [Oscillatoria sp. SIO1A7]